MGNILDVIRYIQFRLWDVDYLMLLQSSDIFRIKARQLYIALLPKRLGDYGTTTLGVRCQIPVSSPSSKATPAYHQSSDAFMKRAIPVLHTA